MKKVMVLAGLLAGGVPSLWADHTKLAVLRSVSNMTPVHFTYIGPDKSRHEIPPRATVDLCVPLHHSPHAEGFSQSRFISQGGIHTLLLTYRKRLYTHRDPYLRHCAVDVLQENLQLTLSYVLAYGNSTAPLAEYKSGMMLRPLSEKTPEYDVHLTLEDMPFLQSRLQVVQRNAAVPPLDLCTMSMPSTPLGSFGSGSESPMPKSPRLVESPR